MAYNMTCIKAAEGIGALALCANDSTGGVLFGFGSLGLTIIMLLVMKRYDFDAGMLATSWMMFVLSGVLAVGGFLNALFPLAYLIIAALVSLYVWTARND